MDPRHLVQLAVILEKGSITQASAHLHLTQPTLTHNMQRLEMQAGGTLFERSRLGVRSTPLGEMLAREGRAIARRLNDAAEVSVQHRSGLKSQVRVGAGPLVGAALMPGLAAYLLEHFPGLALTAHSDRPHSLVEQLIDGRHDLVIAPSWLDRPPAGIERELLVKDELRVFCGRAHPLASRRKWQPAAADACDWISLGTASPFDKEVRDMLTAAGVKATRTQISVVGETFVLLSLLAQGRHLAVLPRFPLRALKAHFPLVELPLPAPPKSRNIYLWYRSALLEAPAMVTIKEAILRYGTAQGTGDAS